MVWHTVAPDGTKSVKTNRAILQDNTTYTETSLNVDHYWNIGADEDGRHQFAQMPKNETAGVPSDPTIGTGMDLIYYAKLKTAVEAVTQQDVNPYIRNSSAVMQLLGIRACAVFDVNAGTHAVTVIYSHNIASVVRTGTGKYTANFLVNLPSYDYLLLGSGIRGNASTDRTMLLATQSGATVNAVKKVNQVLLRTSDSEGSSTDPLQAWFVCFGG